MLSSLAKRIAWRTIARLSGGDYRPLLRAIADDVRLRFPGDNSWAIELQGKAEFERWLQRFAAVGLQVSPDDVVASGFPWDTAVIVRGTVHLISPAGDTVYENRYVVWAHTAWGHTDECEVYEDTQKSAALDEYLVANSDTSACGETHEEEQP